MSTSPRTSASADDADWGAYYRRTAGRAPRPLLLDALPHLNPAGPLRAVDLGCGDGTETLHLLRAGLEVTAIDREPGALQALRCRAKQAGLASLLTTVCQDLAQDVPGTIPQRTDLVVACASLPFLSGPDLAALWTRMLAALRPGGVLAVHLFGDRDSWAAGQSAVEGMTFHRRDEVENLVAGLKVLHLEEREFDGPSGRGPKHWHRYDVIARR